MKPGKIRIAGILICLLLLIVGLGLRVYASALSVSNYPFPTYYSESWRIFEAASVYGRLVFNQEMPLPWLDPARAMLEGLVFLIPGSKIWTFRLWQALLLLGTTLLAALFSYKAARKYDSSAIGLDKIFPVLIIGWGLLYLLQPPFNYHVLLGTIAVLVLFDTSKPFRTLIVIILASAWVGLGRVNWFLMPALVASALYFMVVPVKGKTLVKYFLQPFLWCLSGAGASLMVYAVNLQVNDYVSTIFTPAMDYPFFTQKLWPNSGFSLGLLPGMLILSLPLGLMILWGTRILIKRIHWSRLIALISILVILFVGSTLVSLRSGGGYDLHNYDTFIFLLFLVGLFWGLQAVRMEEGQPENKLGGLQQPFMLALLLIAPVYFSIRSLPLQVVWDQSLAEKTIIEINTILADHVDTKDPILFIDHRQLLVYGDVPSGEVFIPYEKIYLMDMAMANYEPYLDEFEEYLKDQRFSYIVSEPLNIWPQDGRAPWGYENNVYAEYISIPILEYYIPVYMNKEMGVAIYAPNPDIKLTE